MNVGDLLTKAFHSKRLRQLVMLALTSLVRAPKEAIERDPDRAFELAVKAAAKAAGVEVNARQVRLAVAQVALEYESQRLKNAALELLENLERHKLGR